MDGNGFSCITVTTIEYPRKTKVYTPDYLGDTAMGDSDSFELALIIDAPIDVVFELFANLDVTADATSTDNRYDLSEKLSTIGWFTRKIKNKVLGDTHFHNTFCERPHRIVQSLTGDIVADVECIFEICNDKTRVTRKFKAKKLPWLTSINSIREQQRSYLDELKAYIEHKDEFVKRVNHSVTIEPSRMMKYRKQITIEMETQIAADKELVFDVVISDVNQSGQWMESRSDHSRLFIISPDWPKPGSEYLYQINLGAEKPLQQWEIGKISMLECEQPLHALLKERVIAGGTSITMFVDWKFESIKQGTRLSVRYDLTVHNLLLNIMYPCSSFGLEKSVANIIKICESKSRNNFVNIK